MRDLIKHIKVTKVEFFLILGFFISTFSFSIIISSTYRHYSKISEKNRFFDNYNLVTIESKNNIVKMSSVVNILEKSDIHNTSTHPMQTVFEFGNNFIINEVIGACEGFNIENYAKVQGRNLNDKDLNSNSRIAIIGEGLKKYAIDIDGKLYMKIFDESYEVIGIIKNSAFFMNSSIIPIRSLPFINNEYDEFNQLVHKDDINKLENISRDEFNISVREIPKEPIVKYLFKWVPNLKENMYGILLGIVNLILFSIFFANSIKRKIAVMKVLGAKNSHIYKEVLFNILKVSSLGILLGLLISNLTISFMSKAFVNMYSPIDIYNIGITILLVYFVSILVSVVILFNVINFKLLKDIR